MPKKITGNRQHEARTAVAEEFSRQRRTLLQRGVLLNEVGHLQRPICRPNLTIATKKPAIRNLIDGTAVLGLMVAAILGPLVEASELPPPHR
jgi:hypothetical protein